MKYYLSTSVVGKSFEETEQRVVELLQQEGFGIVSQLNMQETFKNKLQIETQPYKILGACNPGFAHKALSEQAAVGVFLPCNVCLQQNEGGQIKVFVINPAEAMKAVNNETLDNLAGEITLRLERVLKQL